MVRSKRTAPGRWSQRRAPSSATVHTPWASSARAARPQRTPSPAPRRPPPRRAWRWLGSLPVVRPVAAAPPRRRGRCPGRGRAPRPSAASWSAGGRTSAQRLGVVRVRRRPADVAVGHTASSIVTSSTAVACVGRLRAKRSISDRSRVTCASASAAGAAETAASASSSVLGGRSCDPHLDVPEAGRRGAVRDVHLLPGLALAAVQDRLRAATPTPSRRRRIRAQKAGVWPA